MSIRVVPYHTGGFEVDIRIRLPNGSRHRERRILSHSSKSAAQRWGQDRERHLLQQVIDGQGAHGCEAIPRLRGKSPIRVKLLLAGQGPDDH